MKVIGEQSTVFSFLGFSRNVSGQKLLVYHVLILIHRAAKLYSQRRSNLKILDSAPGLHCVLLHQIYHNDKTGVGYSERCYIALFLFKGDRTLKFWIRLLDYIAYRCICYITRTKLVLCIQNGTVSHLEFVHKVQMLKLRGLCTYTGQGDEAKTE